jgi:hypothetical protein
MGAAAATALVLTAATAAQSDSTPPRIVSISPTPAGGLNDQFGLATLSIQFSEPVLVESPPLVLGVAGGFAVTCPPKTDPSAMRVPTGPGWALETLDETDTTHP